MEPGCSITQLIWFAARSERLLSSITAPVRALPWRCCFARKRYLLFAAGSFQLPMTCAT